MHSEANPAISTAYEAAQPCFAPLLQDAGELQIWRELNVRKRSHRKGDVVEHDAADIEQGRALHGVPEDKGSTLASFQTSAQREVTPRKTSSDRSRDCGCDSFMKTPAGKCSPRGFVCAGRRGTLNCRYASASPA